MKRTITLAALFLSHSFISADESPRPQPEAAAPTSAEEELENAHGISTRLRLFLLAASAGCGTVSYKCGAAALGSDSLPGKLTAGSVCALSGGSSLLFLALAYPLGDMLHDAILEDRKTLADQDERILQKWRQEIIARAQERDAHAAQVEKRRSRLAGLQQKLFEEFGF